MESLSEVLVIKIGKLNFDVNAVDESEKSEWKEWERKIVFEKLFAKPYSIDFLST